MRIAVNTRFLLPGRLEGLGGYTHEMVRRMVAAHPDDEFVLLFDRPFDSRFVYGPNTIPVAVFPPARHPILWYAWFEWAVPRALRRYRPDVFFSPDAYCSLSAKTPTAMTVHDLSPLHLPDQIPFWPRRYYAHFLPRYIRRADRLITISDYVKSDMVKTLGIENERIMVAHNGARDMFVPLSETEKTNIRQRYTGGLPYFFYTGAIHPRKNIPRLIEAFDQFKTATGAPDLLLLGGRFAWGADEVSAALRRSPFQRDIRALGYVSEAELPRLMAAAEGLVYVSLNEGFGLPLLEAMRCDTPVITSDCTSMPEVAGEAGLLVNPLRVDSIAEAMIRLHRSPELSSRLVAAGRVQRAKFDWDIAAEKVYSTLCELK